MNIKSLLLIGVSAVVLTGCEETPRPLMDPVATEQLFAFALPDHLGLERTMADHQGWTLLVNFWATWCGPCREEMPALSRLHQARAGTQFRVLAVHVGPGDVSKFLEEVPVAFPIVVDENLELAHLDVNALPTTLLVSPEGRILYKAVGQREWDSEEAHAFFNSLITPEPAPRKKFGH